MFTTFSLGQTCLRLVQHPHSDRNAYPYNRHPGGDRKTKAGASVVKFRELVCAEAVMEGASGMQIIPHHTLSVPVNYTSCYLNGNLCMD